MSTYLDMVNNVLTRLREPTVSSVQDNSYSKLIGIYINDAKREVEDAYDWNSLTDTLTATTTDSLFNYVLTGSGTRFRVIDVLNELLDSTIINFDQVIKDKHKLTNLFGQLGISFFQVVEDLLLGSLVDKVEHFGDRLDPTNFLAGY